MIMRIGDKASKWYQTVTPENIRDIDPKGDYGFRGALDNALWRPVAFRPPRIMGPVILALGENDTFEELPVSYIPHLSSLLQIKIRGIPDVPLAKLHPRHAGTVQPREYERVFALPHRQTGRIPAAKFVFGENPDCPDKSPRFYIAAMELGSLSLNGADPIILPEEEQEVAFFPVPRDL